MKKKKKMGESEMKLILILLALLLLAGAYFLIFRRSVSAAVVLEEQNEVDRKTVSELEDMERRRAQVETETEEYKQLIRDIIEKYPSDVPTEKAITIVQDSENYAGIHILSIGFSMKNLVLDFTRSSDETPDIPTGYYAELTLNYDVNYQGLKDVFAYLGKLEDRMTVPTVSASYDPVTDMLSGAITINMYYLENTGKEYVPPVLPGIDKGVDSIFGAGDGIPSNALPGSGTETEEGEGAEETPEE